MARYLMEWHIVEALMPGSPKEIAISWKKLATLVNEDLRKGNLKDWGAYPGERRGYSIFEGTDLELMKMTTQYAPHVSFTVHQVSGLETVVSFLDAVSRG